MLPSGSVPAYHHSVNHHTMNTCPCIESVKTLVTTGKWEGGCCECGKKLPLGHLLIAGVVGLMLSVLVGGLLFRRRG